MAMARSSAWSPADPITTAGLASLLLLLVTACPTDAADDAIEGTTGDTSGSTGSDVHGTTGSSGGGAADETDGSETSGGTDPGEDTEGELPENYALGTIALSRGGSPSVSVRFLPDADLEEPSCAETVAGCQLERAPDCGGECPDGFYCGFNPGCFGECFEVCDADCDDDEICYFAAPGQAACREREDFDAGSIALSGTTPPLTLLPPYTVEQAQDDMPFTPGAELRVVAQGAPEAGFEAFDVSFTAVEAIEPHFDEITAEQALGDDDLSVSWTPGEQQVEVSVVATGIDSSTGTLTCPAEDAQGSLQVPREAILAAIPGTEVRSLRVSVTRLRREILHGFQTRGELSYAEVQPDGVLHLETRSLESERVSCESNEAFCGGACVDILDDNQNCGGCDEVCAGQCNDGICD